MNRVRAIPAEKTLRNLILVVFVCVAVSTMGAKEAKAQLAPPGYLRVTLSPTIEGSIYVDGVRRDAWALEWLSLQPGTHTISYGDHIGYTTPADQVVTVSSGATTTRTGNYTQRAELRVITQPAVPSTISIDGHPADDWGLWTHVPAGTRTVCFGAVADFATPPCQQASMTAGLPTVLTGQFTSSPGSPGPTGHGYLRVITNPPAPSQITIARQLSPGVFDTPKIADSWGVDWAKVQPGVWKVEFSDVLGWATPPYQLVTVPLGGTGTVTAQFTQMGKLRVDQSSPVADATVYAGPPNQALEVPRNDFRVNGLELPPGPYQVCFGSVAFRSPPGCRTGTILAGQTVTEVIYYGDWRAGTDLLIFPARAAGQTVYHYGLHYDDNFGGAYDWTPGGASVSTRFRVLLRNPVVMPVRFEFEEIADCEVVTKLQQLQTSGQWAYVGAPWEMSFLHLEPTVNTGDVSPILTNVLDTFDVGLGTDKLCGGSGDHYHSHMSAQVQLGSPGAYPFAKVGDTCWETSPGSGECQNGALVGGVRQHVAIWQYATHPVNNEPLYGPVSGDTLPYIDVEWSRQTMSTGSAAFAFVGVD